MDINFSRDTKLGKFGFGWEPILEPQERKTRTLPQRHNGPMEANDKSVLTVKLKNVVSIVELCNS